MTFMIDLGKLGIAQARAGKTLAELGVSQYTMYRAQNGKPVRPTTLHKLAIALNCDPADLIKDGDVR